MPTFRQALTGRHLNHLERVRRNTAIGVIAALALAACCCQGEKISRAAKSAYHALDIDYDCAVTPVQAGLGTEGAALEAREPLGIDVNDGHAYKAIARTALHTERDYAAHNGHVPAIGTQVETCVVRNWLVYPHNGGWNAQVTIPR